MFGSLFFDVLFVMKEKEKNLKFYWEFVDFKQKVIMGKALREIQNDY